LAPSIIDVCATSRFIRKRRKLQVVFDSPNPKQTRGTAWDHIKRLKLSFSPSYAATCEKNNNGNILFTQTRLSLFGSQEKSDNKEFVE
jgi:hypothetical protein